MSKHIPNVWLTWIFAGLNRGCTQQSLLEVMIKEGLDAESSEAAISRVLRGEIEPLTEFFYEPSHIRAGNKIVVSDKTLTVAFRCTQPDIVLIDNLLSQSECEKLIKESLSKLKPSKVVNLKAGGQTFHEARTSEGMCFKLGETKLIQRIERRVSALLNIPEEHGEGIQILHYRVGAEYQPHYDFFLEDHESSQEFLKQGGQRIATLIMYLNDVDEGGETVFPELNLRVNPRHGSALYFSYANSLGQVDEKTLHGGAPVIKGNKWIATKWLRRNRIRE